jgi:DNA-binding CsgD family transcriptional regulator
MGPDRQPVSRTPGRRNLAKLVRSAQRDVEAEKCLIRLVEDIFQARPLHDVKLEKVSGVGGAPDRHWHSAAEAMNAVAQNGDRVRAIEMAENVLSDLTEPAEHRSAWVALLVLVMADDLIAADHHCEALLARPEWHADPRALRTLRLIRARVNALAGEPGLALRVLVEQSRSDEEFLAPVAASWLADAYLRVGDTEAAGTVLSVLIGHRASATTPRHGCPGGAFARLTVADTQLAAGQHLAALASYLYCGVELRDAGFVNGSVVPWSEGAAAVAAEIGLGDLAAVLAARVLDASTRWRSPRKMVDALHLQSRLAARGIGVESPTLSRSLLAVASMGEIGVRSALTGNTSPTEPRGREQDLATAVTSRRTITLTGSELTVARLARAGFTNPQIAERLSLAVRTVEFHLSSVYRKLGVANRRELRSSTFLVTEDHPSNRTHVVEVSVPR